MTLTPSAIVFCPAPGGLLRVPPRPRIALPVTARRLLSITPGDELLIAAAPEYGLVVTHTMRAVEDMRCLAVTAPARFPATRRFCMSA